MVSEDPAAIGWYFAKVGTPAGQEVGPFSREQLVSLAQAGTLMPGDLVCNPRQPRWFPAAQVPGLFAQGAAGGLAGAQARGRMFAWLLPLVAVILVGAGYGLYFGLTRDGVASPFTSTVPSGFQFDDSTAMVVEVDAEPLPRVDALTPIEGPVGTKIKISGSGLASGGLTNVMLGEEELALRSVADELIEAHVPHGAPSGDVMLLFGDEEVNAGRFEVMDQEKQLLLQKELSPSNGSQTVSAGDISVTIPGGALSSTETIAIARIVDPQPVNLPESAQGTAFSVTLGETHEFEEPLTLALKMTPDAVGEPSAAYFDENTSQWRTLPSEVVGSELRVRTVHLTDFFFFYWGSAIYSPKGSFKIFYRADDVTTYKASMAELAQAVGTNLEAIREDYDAKIPAQYRETFTYMGVPDAMDVYLDSSYKEAE